MIEKIERWWKGLSDTQQLIAIIILFVSMLVANPFIS